MPVPPEIKQFFEIDGNTTLLIKGSPGSGKTIFSLEALASLENYYGIFYSTRDIIETLLSQIPWIKNILKKEQLINVRDEKSLNPPSEFDTTNLLDLTTLPQFLKTLFLTLGSLKRKIQKTPLIVIDSLDALSSILELPKHQIIKNIRTLLLQMKCKGIITVETEKEDDIDFMNDGVIYLRRTQYHNRLFRIFEIKKLRGIDISKGIYSFTLDKSHFNYFEKTLGKLSSNQFQNPHEPIPDKEDFSAWNYAKISSGSEQLDDIVGGGFDNGSCIAFIYDKHFVNYAYGAIIECFVENALMLNRHVIYMAKKTVKSKIEYELYEGLTTKDKVDKYLHVVSIIDKNINIDLDPSATNSFKNFKKEFLRTIQNYMGQTNSILTVLDLDHLCTCFSIENEELFNFLTHIINMISGTKSLLLLKMYNDRKIASKTIQLARYAFFLFSKRGSHFIYGLKPFTPIYHIRLEIVDGHPRNVLQLIS